jgi:DNA modification methylase
MENELIFPGKKHPYEKLCCNESYKHPAKADYWMMEWIISNMTEEGNTILDPMAGVGRTGVSAVLKNRKCIMIELEEKFVEWAKMNMDGITCLIPPDMYKIIHGDARNLTGLLLPGGISAIVTSPPYGNSIRSKKNTGRFGREDRLRQAGYDPKDYMGGEATACNMEWRYSHNEDNIGNLPDMPIDAIITSPPYEKAKKGGGIAINGLPNDPNLARRSYSQTALNISSSDGNIQGLGKETYYNAMLTVYGQCYDVLKPGGKIVIIVKDYIRNFKRVPLGENTIKMLEKVGFQYQESYFRKLNNFSFWIHNYRKKYPEADKVDHEEIIVAVKPVYEEKFNELEKKVDQLLEENETLLSTIQQNTDELNSRCKGV